MPAQIATDGKAEIFTMAASNGFTVIVIVLEVAGVPVAQVAVDVIITWICSPLTKVDEVYIDPVSPVMGAESLYHWYVGVPPLIGVALKVTVVPAQIAPVGETEILTLAGNNGFTVIVMLLDIAGLPVAQMAVDVICTLIVSPLTSDAEV